MSSLEIRLIGGRREKNLSVAELCSVDPAIAEKVLSGLNEKQWQEIQYAWWFWSRPAQRAPEGQWATWMLRAGRGFGKTRAGAAWVHERAMVPFPVDRTRRIALVAKTPADARDFMIEGQGGILRNTPPSERPDYEPSKRRLVWPMTGAWATVFSSEDPDQLRGFSGDTAWLDEPAKYDTLQSCLDNLDFGMREASIDRPRKLLTTTPRPLATLLKLEKRPSTVVTWGDSYENRANLDPAWFEDTILAHEGTRFGRQEIHAEYLTDTPGALWTRKTLEQAEHGPIERDMLRRVVVGVDPSGTAGGDEGSNDVGIIAVGIGFDGMGYVLDDWTCNLSPKGWARRTAELYNKWMADLIVAERNFGGEMVRSTIQTVDANLPVKLVQASRGKVARAEPVASLYEHEPPAHPGRVKHTPKLDLLEDEMVLMTPDGYVGEGSPNRVDACVWAITELMLNRAQWQLGDMISGPRLITVED